MSLAFPTTQWSLVRKLADPESREDALSTLCQNYWAPVYAFLCRRYQSADAEDITQEFFSLVVRQELFQRANSAEGKLRSWLLKSLEYCVANRARSMNSIKRGGRVTIKGLADESLRSEMQDIAADAATPEDAFDKAWLASLLHNTIESLGKQYRDAEKQQLFEALQPWLIGGDDDTSQTEAAAKCGLSVPHFRVQLHRLRKRYAQELRGQIITSVDNDNEVEEEIQRLFQISKKPSQLGS